MSTTRSTLQVEVDDVQTQKERNKLGKSADLATVCLLTTSCRLSTDQVKNILIEKQKPHDMSQQQLTAKKQQGMESLNLIC